jgi:CHASE3 domain sensor protein
MRKVILSPARGGFALALAILVLIGVLSYQSNRSLVEHQDAIFRGQEVKNASTSCSWRSSKRRARRADS